jgi:Protein of unknown function (DUF2806)
MLWPSREGEILGSKKDLVASKGSAPAGAPDELSGAVAIKAAWSAHGVTLGAQSRAVAAADRLIGGIVGIPAAYFEGVRSRIELRNQITAAQIEQVGSRALEDTTERITLDRASAERFVAEQVRKLANRDAVWLATVAAEEQLAQSDADSPQPQTDQADEAEIDDDWMNSFCRHAEDATSDWLRKRWGRIMAGEIRKPGSFSRSTLRAVSELDTEVALKFQATINECVDDMWIKPSSNIEGEPFERLSNLEEAGLVSGADGNMRRFYSPVANSQVWVPAGPYFLNVKVRNPALQRLSFNVVLLTKVGRQIASIMERDNLAAIRRSIPFMTEAETVTIAVHQVQLLQGRPTTVLVPLETVSVSQ